jgi:hypothetical protein
MGVIIVDVSTFIIIVPPVGIFLGSSNNIDCIHYLKNDLLIGCFCSKISHFFYYYK